MRRCPYVAAVFAMLVVATPSQAQTIYPIDRADILAGARFDFKVEFPGLVDPARISVTVNGEDYAKVFGPDTLLDPKGSVPLDGVPHFYVTSASGEILKDLGGLPAGVEHAETLASILDLP